MAKNELTKSIEARKLNKRTGAPIGGWMTIPFGALIDNLERDRDLERFTYLGELYHCPHDILISALKNKPVEEDETASAGVEEALPPAAVAGPTPEPWGPLLAWQSLRSSHGAVRRAKLPGGWLVLAGSALTFVPDAAHEWDGGSLEAPSTGSPQQS